MAFDTQITDLVGGTIDQVACDQWAADACKEIIGILPDKLKAKCAAATELSDSPTVMDMDAVGEILHVTRLSADSGGYQIAAREIPAQYGGLATDSTDLNYYGTVTDPVYWVDGNTSDAATLYVKPTPTSAQTSIVHHISYPTVNVSDVSTIANFPDEAEYLVVLYAAVKQLQQYMNSKSSDLPSDLTLPVLETASQSLPTWSAPSDFAVPTKPVVPSISSQSVADFSSSEPSYTKPSLVLKVAPSISNLSISAVAPASISAPSFSTPTIGDVTVTATTLTNAGTAPLYAKPTLTSRVAFSSYTSGLSETDPGVFSISAVAPAAPSINTIAYSDATNADASATGVDTVNAFAPTKIDVSSHAPTFTKPVFTSASAYLTEMEAGTIGDAASDIDQEHWFSIVGQYIEDNEDVELAQAQLQKISTFVNAYQVDIQNELNEYNKDNTRYQMEFQEEVNKANQDLQVAISNANALAQEKRQEAQQTTSVDQFNKQQDQALNLANAAKTMEKLIQDNNSKLQKFSNENSVYQANVNKEVSEYGQKLQHYSTELNTAYQAWSKTEADSLQQYSIDIQNNLNDFNRANAEYQVKLQEAIQQAQISAQKAQQDAQLEATDQQQSASLLLQKENQEYSSKLQKYQAELSTYQADVNTQIQQYQQNLAGDIQVWQAERSTDLQKYGSDIQNELNKFNEENVIYQAKVQEFIQEAQLLDAHEARKMQKYQAEVGAYSAELNANVQTFTNALTKNKAAFDTSIQKYTSDVSKVSASNASILQKFQAETADFSARLQKQTTDYTWYQGQYTQLKADYAAGMAALKGT